MLPHPPANERGRNILQVYDRDEDTWTDVPTNVNSVCGGWARLANGQIGLFAGHYATIDVYQVSVFVWFPSACLERGSGLVARVSPRNTRLLLAVYWTGAANQRTNRLPSLPLPPSKPKQVDGMKAIKVFDPSTFSMSTRQNLTAKRWCADAAAGGDGSAFGAPRVPETLAQASNLLLPVQHACRPAQCSSSIRCPAAASCLA